MYDWQRTFLVDVPGYADLIGQSLEVVWECYREALDNFCVKHAGLSFRDTVRVHQAVENAEKHLILSARKILAKFRISAQDIHPIFREEIKRFMGPVFDEAHSMTGTQVVSTQFRIIADDMLQEVDVLPSEKIFWSMSPHSIPNAWLPKPANRWKLCWKMKFSSMPVTSKDLRPTPSRRWRSRSSCFLGPALSPPAPPP